MAPMDAVEAMKTRRSIRKYKVEDVPEDVVTTILDCGRWAPSAGNRQPWRFIIVRDSVVRKRLATAFPTGSFVADVPVAIAVVIDPAGSTHPVEDGAAATQNILLAAHALGLGSCWVGTYNSANEGIGKEILGAPAEHRLLSIIAIGYPAESPTKTRKDLAELTFTDRYGGTG